MQYNIINYWRKQWHPTPVLLPGESQGWGAWWAVVYGVAQSRTRLKWLSRIINYSPHTAHYVSNTYFTHVSFIPRLFDPFPSPCLFSMYLWGFVFFFLSQCINDIIWYLFAFLCVICLFIRQRFYTVKMFDINFGSKAVIPNFYNFILGSMFKCIGRLWQR